MFATECALRGCEVVIAVRQKSMKEAQELAEHIHDISGAKVSVADIDTLGQGDTGRFQLLINATPVGMYPKTEASPVKEEFYPVSTPCLTASITQRKLC